MSNMLPILAVETTGELCSTAVILGKNSFVELNFLQKHVHSKKIIGLIDQVLSSAELKLNNVRTIAVSSGPGSFTGVRIGLSAVKGLAFGSNIGVIPVPSFSAFALQLARTLAEKTKFILSVKASMEKIYAGKYVSDNNNFSVINDVRLINLDEYTDLCKDTDLIFGNLKTNPDYLNASAVGLWAYIFGKDLLTFDYDYIEPEYFGNPFLETKKKS